MENNIKALFTNKWKHDILMSGLHPKLRTYMQPYYRADRVDEPPIKGIMLRHGSYKSDTDNDRNE